MQNLRLFARQILANVPEQGAPAACRSTCPLVLTKGVACIANDLDLTNVPWGLHTHC